MRIGFCTTDYPTLPADELFGRMAAAGAQVTQLSFASVAECGFTPSGVFEIPFTVEEAALDAIRAASEKYGIEIVCINGTYNMAHPDPAVREEGVARFAGFARAVRALGAPYVSLCSGTRNRADLWSAHPDNDTYKAFADTATGVMLLTPIAKRYGLTLALETEVSNTIDTPEKARQLMDEYGGGALNMIIDCANLFHPGQAYPQQVRYVIGHAFEVFGRDIVIAHAKDIAEGAGVQFCPTGEGIVDYPYCIEQLRAHSYTGDMLIHGVYDQAKRPPRCGFCVHCYDAAGGKSCAYTRCRHHRRDGRHRLCRCMRHSACGRICHWRGAQCVKLCRRPRAFADRRTRCSGRVSAGRPC